MKRREVFEKAKENVKEIIDVFSDFEGDPDIEIVLWGMKEFLQDIEKELKKLE